MTELAYLHVFRPGAEPGAPTLLLLHGTGGNEHDLLPLAAQLSPTAGVLSPRGNVLERGMPRFFRRLAEGVFDIEDLRRRTDELADFVSASSHQSGFASQSVIAVGFSNGANIAASLLLLRPKVLAGAILFRAMVPLVPEKITDATRTPVLISNGQRDLLVSAEQTEQLASLLRSTGADVTVAWQNSGHELTQQDVITARDWLAQRQR